MMLLSSKLIYFSLLGSFSLILLVHAQDDDQLGFISIDCGRTENSSYTEMNTGINYISDTGFVDTGESKLVLSYVKDMYHQQPYWGVRSFPDGTRNCYKVNVTGGTKYLIRASFVYGNYDGKGELPTFLLHLGTNLWDSVSVQNESYAINKELIHVAPRNYIHVCLVNNGSGVPFISALELRPLNITSYPTQIGSLALNGRLDIGQTGPDLKYYRYPRDVHDRFWYPYVDNEWFTLSSSSAVDFDTHNSYQPASVVMNNAAIAKKATDPIMFSWDPPVDANDTEYYVYMHFAELEKLQANESRLQYITNKGELYRKEFAAEYLHTTTILSTKPLRGSQDFSIIKADYSTLPPSINAIEIYTLKEFLELETNQEDVEAITNIKSTYEVTKNWQGDPCLPLNYSWEGLNCSYPQSDSPRIISVDLSSSGLTGVISPLIANLAMIQTLDLSNNNLTGPIPEFLSQLPDLSILNLENNKFTGSLPLGLTQRRENGLLSISLCDNPNMAGNEPCNTKKKKKNKIIIPIIGAVAGNLTLILAGAVFFCLCRRKRQHATNPTIDPKPNPGAVELEQKNRKFTYSEILRITNNRQRVLGKGGFGTVYHGYIDDKTQVAVKLLDPSSSQGLQQFHAEVHLLMRVHHTNLTSLVGYCDDEFNKGLVYEYMANGNLQAYLSDKTADVLTWEGRLQIATEAAQGLEYLHYGCKPPMIHRDVKSTNILLNDKFQAKLSDFGLSRNFAPGDGTHIVTGVAGTPGYLAPEYHQSNRLNEKSDVYSFGIVLFEIITGKPVVLSRTNGERIHITRWVELMLPQGDIYSIIDPLLERNFNINSAWKAVELATACVSAEPSRRPVMSNVVMELKECLAVQLDLTNFDSYETELGNSIDVMSKNHSITMMRPSAR